MNALPGDYHVAEGKRSREAEEPKHTSKHARGQTLSPIGRAVVAYAQKEREQRISNEYCKRLT